MNKYISLIVVLILLSWPTFSQIITVLDSESGAPLETVTLSSNDPRYYTVTNTKGQVVHWRREVWLTSQWNPDHLHSVSTYDVSFLDTTTVWNQRAYIPYKLITQRSQHDNHSDLAASYPHVHSA